MKYKITFLILTFQLQSFAQIDVLKNKIEAITKGKKATVGVAILDLKTHETLTVNDGHYPMQSVFKFHLALAVFNLIDKGKLLLNQKIHVKKEDWQPKTHSPLRDKYAAGNADISLKEILSFTVSQSDNDGCDILFKLAGGTKKVNDFIHSTGVKDVSIVATEAKMHKDWNVQYTNWSSPLAAAKLLESFYQKHILSKNSQAELWKMLVETSTGPTKIKGLLPKDAVVGHKTGWSGTNDAGLTGATNDIGIVTLPNGRQFAIAVFVMNSMEKEATNDLTIAEISKAAYDYFLEK